MYIFAPVPAVFVHPGSELRESPSFHSVPYWYPRIFYWQVVKEAVIAGHDGNIWATSPGMGAQAAELKTLRHIHPLPQLLSKNYVTS